MMFPVCYDGWHDGCMNASHRWLSSFDSSTNITSRWQERRAVGERFRTFLDRNGTAVPHNCTAAEYPDECVPCLSFLALLFGFPSLSLSPFMRSLLLC